MIEFGESATFVDKPLHQLRVVVEVGTQNLDRDMVSMDSIDSLEHAPRSALANFTNGLVAGPEVEG